jgi:hypothetical protein
LGGGGELKKGEQFLEFSDSVQQIDLSSFQRNPPFFLFLAIISKDIFHSIKLLVGEKAGCYLYSNEGSIHALSILLPTH